MKGRFRTIAAVTAGLSVWVVMATLGDLVLRLVVDGYREAERALAFTPMMMIERLALGLLASVASGGLARLVSGPGSPAPWITGFVLLVFFVPVHIDLWGRFPLAYHLFFLASIATVPSLAARFMGRAA